MLTAVQAEPCSHPFQEKYCRNSNTEGKVAQSSEKSAAFCSQQKGWGLKDANPFLYNITFSLCFCYEMASKSTFAS